MGWFDEVTGQRDSVACVAVKMPGNEYSFTPTDVTSSLVDAITRLNETAAVAMASRVTSAVIDSIVPGQRSLIIENNSARIPIVSTLDDINPMLSHFARACIVVKERIVLVWSHDAGAILNVAFDVERQFGKNVQFSRTSIVV